MDKSIFPTIYRFFLIIFVSLLIGCSAPAEFSQAQFIAVDKVFEKSKANISAINEVKHIVDIDHARLGKEAGSSMPPARVMLFSNTAFNTAIIKLKPLVALDLPMRILAYYDVETKKEKLVYNRFDFIQLRHDLKAQPDLKAHYDDIMAKAINGVDYSAVIPFDKKKIKNSAIITINSPYDFNTSKNKILTAISSQSDTVNFGELDFQKEALALGEHIAPSTLILFGGPAPGAKAMSNAPTLGLDAFCQKFLLWQDSSGKTYLSFNDLIELAEIQGANKSLALRVINYRLKDVFESALK